MIKKPWIIKKKILDDMELRLDAAIDKTENLTRYVEIDCMMKKFNSLMEKAHDENAVAMVAEPVSQYGADVFEAYEKAKIASEIVPEEKSFEPKKDGKSR
ncbi:MAG: hypothetical protein PHT84_06155 [Candidatus Pacebacteria bacterium]|nr:hypothetical protein [Candidatus Paceibacterota bacterium]